MPDIEVRERSSMDHELSVRTHAAERYLIGELSGAERAAFEAHYFECEECAEEVRLGIELRESAAAVFREETPRFRALWMRPAMAAPLAACLLLLMVAGYENLLEIPRLRSQIAGLSRPQALSAAVVLAPASRGAAPVVSARGEKRPFVPLSLAIGAVTPAPQYECELLSASGKVLLRIPVERLEPDSNLTLLIPSAEIPAGRYQLVLRARSGQSRSELDRYPFSVVSE